MPFSAAIFSMSKAMKRFEARSAVAATFSDEARPSPGSIFSETAAMRCDEAISVVRSGVTKPRMMARPASISSAAIRMSTSPGDGDSAKIGRRPVSRAIST